MRRKGIFVVVVEIDEQNPHLDDAREQGAHVLIGNAVDDEILRRAQPGRAAELFALAGNDSNNVRIIRMASKLRREYCGSLWRWVWPNEWWVAIRDWIFHHRYAQLRCFVWAENEHIASVAKSISRGGNNSEIDVEFFDPAQIVANDLVLGQLPNQIPYDLVRDDKTRSAPKRPPTQYVQHFVLIGFGRKMQQIARSLAEMVHLENETRSRMTILYDQPDRIAKFRSTHGSFGPLRFHEDLPLEDAFNLAGSADHWNAFTEVKQHSRSPMGDIPDGVIPVQFAANASATPLPADPASDDVIHAINALVSDESDSLPFVIVCTDDPNRDLGIAQRLR
ncbi:MAG: NAD-binding protein, partial [Planctomycetota bacterium]